MLDWIIGLFPSFGSWVWRKFFGPRLRLGFLADPASSGVQGDRDQHVFPVVANGNRWQVVFGLVLRNGGKQEARNWRVRLVTLETSTMLGLDKRPDHRSITETPIGSGWQYEVHAAGPSDTLLPHMPVYIAGRHTLNFGGKPNVVSIKCWLTAEDVPVREATLRVAPDWTNMTALFRWQ